MIIIYSDNINKYYDGSFTLKIYILHIESVYTVKESRTYSMVRHYNLSGHVVTK